MFASDKTTDDVYYPWEIWDSPEPRVYYQARPYPVASIFYQDPGLGGLSKAPSRPRRIWARKTRALRRFSTGMSLRRQGKARILGRLRVQEVYPHGRAVLPRNIAAAPQLPLSWPEFAGFDQVPEGTVNTTGASAPERNVWGQLQNLLTQVGQAVFTAQQQKTARDIAAAQAAAAQAQAEAAKASVMGAMYRNLPLLAAVVGGGVLVYYIAKRK